MAIGTDAAVDFFGTQDTITGSGGTVADAAYGAAATTWTNDDDAPTASIILDCSFGTAPDAGSSVNLYLQLLDVQSTNDQPVPDANYQHYFVGSFPVDAGTTAQIWSTIIISLPNNASSQQYNFYIENQAGQTIDTDWDLHITPKTIGPHA